MIDLAVHGSVPCRSGWRRGRVSCVRFAGGLWASARRACVLGLPTDAAAPRPVSRPPRGAFVVRRLDFPRRCPRGGSVPRRRLKSIFGAVT